MKLSKAGVRLLVGITGLWGFILTIGALIFIPIPETNEKVLYVLVGFLGAMASQIVGFYFGDSDSRSGG